MADPIRPGTGGGMWATPPAALPADRGALGDLGPDPAATVALAAHHPLHTASARAEVRCRRDEASLLMKRGGDSSRRADEGCPCGAGCQPAIRRSSATA